MLAGADQDVERRLSVKLVSLHQDAFGLYR